MHVSLVKYTQDPEKTCAVAAMYSVKEKIDDAMFTGVDYDKAMSVLRRTVASGHHSVLEHASFTFNVSEVSRALTHQLVRHRIASYTQQSQRYVKLKGKGYVTPEKIEKSEFAKEYHATIDKINDFYTRMLDAKIPAEDARYILPNAAHTSIVITMNARELLHFFSLRSCNRAQWEIRALSDEMLKQVKAVAPAIFSKAGPSCIRGACSEGEWTCGKPRTSEPLFK